jgi:hypothetical protein
MLRLFFMMMVALAAIPATAQFSRNYNFTEDLDVFPEPQALNFYQREKVTITYEVLRDNQPVNLVDEGIISVWEVTTQTNPITAVIVVTAQVVSATSGVIRFSLEPNRAGVPEGKYDGFVRMFKKVGSDFVESGMIQRQNVDIRRSPPSEGINFIGPVWWDRYDPNFLSIDELVVNRIVPREIEFGGSVFTNFPAQLTYSARNFPAPSYPQGQHLRDIFQGTDQSNTRFNFYQIAGEGGITTFYTNNALVISGNATGSVDQLFAKVAGKATIYYRPSINNQQITALSASNFPANLATDGTNMFWATGLEAGSFGGQGPGFYRNFQNLTNIWVFDGNADPVTLSRSDIAGFEVGGALGFVFTNRSVGGVTSTILRIENNSFLATNVADLLTRSNFWSGFNRFEHGIQVNNRIRHGGVVGGNPALFSTIGGGGSNNLALGPFSTVIGGRDSVASGTDSIAGGRGASASGSESVALGFGALGGAAGAVGIGRGATARGAYSTSVGGFSGDAVGSYSATLGGQYAKTDASFSWAMGSYMNIIHPWNYAFGSGTAITNPIISQRNYAFWIDSGTTNLFFLGVNTNKPSVTGAVFQAVGGPVAVESVVFPDGSSLSSSTNIGAGNVTLTSAWSMVYSDGDKNSVSLPLGASNFVLVSTGPSNAPVFMEYKSGTITQVTANATHFNVTGSTGPVVNISLNDTAATNLWKADQAYGYLPGIANVSGRVVTLEGYVPGIANVSGRVVNLESNLGNVSGRVVTLEGYLPGIANVSGRVVTLEGYLPGIANVSGRVVNLESNLGNVSGRVVAIEGWTTDNLAEGLTNKYADDWSRYPATQNVNYGYFSATNLLGVGFNLTNNVLPDQGHMRWSTDFETVSVGLTGGYKLPLGEASVFPVVNQSGSSIAKGTLLQAAGVLGMSGKILVAPSFFQGSNMLSQLIMGIAAENIPNGESGYAVDFGRVRGFDTSMFGANSILYADPFNPGQMTTNRPSAPYSKTIVALVLNSSSNVGSIWVRPTFGSSLANDELVNLGTLSNNDALLYDSTALAFTNKQLGTAAFSNTNAFINVINGTGTVNALSAGGIRITSAIDTNNLQSVPTLEFLATYNPIGAVTNATLIALNGTPYDGILNLDPAKFATNETGQLTITPVDNSWSVTNVSGSYTAAVYNLVNADTLSDSTFVYLPPASSTTGGVISARKATTNNFLFVVAGAGDYVQGVATVGLTRAGNVIDLFSDGTTNWWLK